MARVVEHAKLAAGATATVEPVAKVRLEVREALHDLLTDERVIRD